MSKTGRARRIMVQGTMSGAGKSLLCAALCRIFTRDGWEMGRAQVVQAQAAGVEPDVRMNPVLLKPCSDTGSQVIVSGALPGQCFGPQAGGCGGGPSAAPVQLHGFCAAGKSPRPRCAVCAGTFGAAAAGTPVLGVCGGYQMLGRALYDPEGTDGGTAGGSLRGLGLLPVEAARAAAAARCSAPICTACSIPGNLRSGWPNGSAPARGYPFTRRRPCPTRYISSGRSTA